jgi:hypothetical protein
MRCSQIIYRSTLVVQHSTFEPLGVVKASNSSGFIHPRAEIGTELWITENSVKQALK